MTTISIEREGVLYINPRPAYQAISAMNSYILPISDSELLAVYRKGQAYYSVDGGVYTARSTDGGNSWVEEGCAWDPQCGGEPFSYGYGMPTLLAGGEMLLATLCFDRSDPEAPVFNEVTGGVRGNRTVLQRSQDLGRSWSAPELLPLPDPRGEVNVPSPIIELENGRLFLPCEVWKPFDDPTPLHLFGFGLFSDDGGRNWGDRVDYPSATDAAKMYSHTRYIRMRDGRLGGLQWTQPVGGQGNCHLSWVSADPTGKRWDCPKPTNLFGQTSWAVDLGGGVLAAISSIREEREPGEYVFLSHDGGLTWNVDGGVVVWDAVGQEFLGVQHKPSYPRSHDNIAFGAPTLTQAPDGALFASWWCTQASITHVRYAKLRVE